jgi:uncharacterized membrane protein
MTDNTKRVLGLVCLLLNIVLPWAMSLLLVGIGGIIYGAVQKERKFLRNGIAQLVISFSSLAIGFCWVFFLVFFASGGGIIAQDSPFMPLLILLPFMALCPGVPLGMYAWSVVDAVKLYRHSQSAN